MKAISVICIGGSSGSIEVIHDILASLPHSFNVPILIALHRHFTSQDTLMRLLRSHGMPAIVEPYDKDPLSDGAVYLAPPDYHMMVDSKSICLSTDPPENHARPSIDILFESVARAFGQGAVGVVLSGANQDGASGALAIHRGGGRVIVQEPVTARVPTMPLAASCSVPSAHALPVTKIVEALAGLLKQERAADG